MPNSTFSFSSLIKNNFPFSKVDMQIRCQAMEFVAIAPAQAISEKEVEGADLPYA